MSYMDQTAFAPMNDIQEMRLDEIDIVSGGDALGEVAKAAAKAIIRSPIKFAGGVGVGITLAAVAVLVVAELAEQ